MWTTIGQSDLTSLFESSLRTNTLSHAYLITGQEHTGKTTLAYDLAMALNCQGNNPPCGSCISCKKISKKIHPDIVEISLESLNNGEQKTKKEIGIDEIKKLQQIACLPPFEGKYKVFIINEADRLSLEAANCLLKTLEEPLPNVTILLVTAEETNLLPTLISRCQRVRLRPMPINETEELLVKKFNRQREESRIASRLSKGCLGYAISIIDDAKQLENRNRIINELISLIHANINERFSRVARFEDDRKITQEMLAFWLNWWHDLMLIKSDNAENVSNVDFISELETQAVKLNLFEIKEFIIQLRKSLLLASKNVNIRLLLDVLMLDMPMINV